MSCSSKTTVKEKYDYEEVTSEISWSETFNQREDLYLVYFYKESCGYCQSIKSKVLNYYFFKKEVMYFVDCEAGEAIYGPTKDLKGMSDISNFYIFGTPFLIKIKEKKIDSYYPGMNKILEYIDKQK